MPPSPQVQSLWVNLSEGRVRGLQKTAGCSESSGQALGFGLDFRDKGMIPLQNFSKPYVY